MKSLKYRITTAIAAIALAGITIVSATAGQPSETHSPAEDDAPIVYAGGFGLFPSN